VEYKSIAEMMQAHAEEAVATARAYRVSLDYAEASLEKLEEILAGLCREMPRSKPSAEQIEQACRMWGGYLGEVVRRRWGGDWSLETYPGANFATPTLTIVAGKMFPTMKVHRRLFEGPKENIWNFYGMMRRKLEALVGKKVH
jgi:hypothetical protein